MSERPDTFDPDTGCRQTGSAPARVQIAEAAVLGTGCSSLVGEVVIKLAS
jgi:hypothetical protein